MSTWEDSGTHAEGDRWTYQPFLGSSRRGAWVRSKVVQKFGLRALALAGLAAGVGMVITSEALTFRPNDVETPQRSFRTTDVVPVSQASPPVAMAFVSESSREASTRPSGFVKATAAELEDLKALAGLQAAARLAAEVQLDPVRTSAATETRIASLEPVSSSPAAAEVAFSPDVEARLPSFEVVAEPELTASINNRPLNAATEALPGVNAVDGEWGATSSEATAEQLAMLPRLPMPRPDPPKVRVRKAGSGALGPPPNCGTKHAYWRNRGGKKVWYCR